MIDLHAHTNCSDGSHDPADLVRQAVGLGVKVLAITDHDTMAGVREGMDAGAVVGVQVIPGIELSIKVPHGSMHLLGYFASPAPEPLAGRIAGFGDIRTARAREMVGRLNDMGVPVDWADVVAGAAGAPLGRPHIAEALIRAGHVSERREAFDLYLGDGKPAFTGSDGLGVEEGIALVRESGGAPVLAHPSTLRLDDRHLDPFVGRLRKAGLAGIEVHRPEHTAEHFATYRALARKYDLIPSGGSDYHGPTSPHGLGSTGNPPLPHATVELLMAAALR